MRSALGAAVTMLLAACSTAPADTVDGLDGTSWRLTEIQSMSDEQGTTVVPPGQIFTVEFGVRDDGVGQAAIQVDCNRASAPWRATAAEPESSGELSFGPLATTEMACPAGSLDQQVTAALAAVRTYLLQDGQLHLSLFADSGIMTWAPTG